MGLPSDGVRGKGDDAGVVDVDDANEAPVRGVRGWPSQGMSYNEGVGVGSGELGNLGTQLAESLKLFLRDTLSLRLGSLLAGFTTRRRAPAPPRPYIRNSGAGADLEEDATDEEDGELRFKGAGRVFGC